MSASSPVVSPVLPPPNAGWGEWLFLSTRPSLVPLYGFLVYYIIIVSMYFNTTAAIWENAVIVAVLIGIALNANAYRGDWPEFVANKFAIARFFVIPFAVSSFSAIVEHERARFFSIFPRHAADLLLSLFVSLAACVAMWLLHRALAGVLPPRNLVPIELGQTATPVLESDDTV